MTHESETRMTQKTWLEVALNGGGGEAHQHLMPISPDDLIAEGIACVEAKAQALMCLLDGVKGGSTLRRATNVSTSSEDAENGPGCSGFTRRAGDAASASAATRPMRRSRDFARILDSRSAPDFWHWQGAVRMCSGFQALLRQPFLSLWFRLYGAGDL